MARARLCVPRLHRRRSSRLRTPLELLADVACAQLDKLKGTRAAIVGRRGITGMLANIFARAHSMTDAALETALCRLVHHPSFPRRGKDRISQTKLQALCIGDRDQFDPLARELFAPYFPKLLRARDGPCVQ